MHAGIDIGGARGTPVYTPKAGTVERIALNSAPARSPFGGYGNAVVVRYPEGVWTFFAHLNEILVAEGQQVAAGQLIGRIGNTTNGKFPGMGVHLHMEVRRAKQDGSSPFPGSYGRYNLDPESWLSANGIQFAGRPRRLALGPTACLPGGSNAQVAVARNAHHGIISGLAGLGDVGENAEYEPVVADFRYFGSTPALVHGILLAPFIVVGAVAVTAITRG